MQSSIPIEKTCVLCGEDCSRRRRIRDKRGNYYCETCHERARTERANRPAPRAEQTMIAEALAETPAVEPCPRCGFALAPAAVLCTSCGFDRQTGLRYESAVAWPSENVPAPSSGGRWERVLERGRDDARRAARLEYFVPAAMLVLGLAGVFALLVARHGHADPDAMLGGYLVGLGLDLVAGVAGLFLAARLWLGGAGPLALGILRLAGIYAVVDAVAILVSPLLALGWVLPLGVYLGLLSRLFDMDLRDAAMLGLLTFALKMALTFGFVVLAIGA